MTPAIETKEPMVVQTFYLDKSDVETVLKLCQQFGALKSDFYRQAVRNEIDRLQKLEVVEESSVA